MSQFNSFNNSTKKFQKIWEQNEENTSQINNDLQTINADFSSINFSKKIITIPVVQNRLFTVPILGEFLQVNLINFPEWLLNHINIVPIVTPVGDINTDTIFFSTDEAKDSGFAKIGDLTFTHDTKSWIAKLSDNNYLLKIFINLRVQVFTTASLSQTAIVPSTLDINLKIINPRIYEKFNFHKT